jgi:hypothetical protein
MVRLKNRFLCPPSGFIVDVPETGYHQTFWGFDEAVSAMMSHLAANPGIFLRYPQLPRTKGACEEYIDTRNAQRCLSIKGADSYIISGEATVAIPKTQAPVGWRRRAGAVVAHSRQTLSGLQLVADWVGAGGHPVAKELAEKRAEGCVICPLNQKGDFWQKLDAIAAEEIRKLLSAKNDLKLATTLDEQLHVCQACDCYLPLKVWSPLKHITNHLKPDVKAKLWEKCWIRTEGQA